MLCDMAKEKQHIMDGIKDASELTLRWGDYPGLAGEPNVITSVLKGEKGRQMRRTREMAAWKGLGLTSLAIKWGHKPRNVSDL